MSVHIVMIDIYDVSTQLFIKSSILRQKKLLSLKIQFKLQTQYGM